MQKLLPAGDALATRVVTCPLAPPAATEVFNQASVIQKVQTEARRHGLPRLFVAGELVARSSGGWMTDWIALTQWLRPPRLGWP